MRMTLTPPVIPSFMANVVQLTPIEGLPSDGEVKKVLHAIRLVTELTNGQLEMPEKKNEDLMMELSQHLFEVQMARYRDIYPCSIFPSDTTYTPPPLPEIFSIQLEPIKGAPSDKQIQSVQAALRKSELTAKIPPMFDADLNMKLSQHLFNIQFAASPHAVASVVDAARQGFETPSLLESEAGSEAGSDNDVAGSSSEAGSDPNVGSPQDPNHPERRSTHHEHNVSTVEPPSSASDVRQLSNLLKGVISEARAAVHTENQPANPVERTHESVPANVKAGFEETNTILAKIDNGLEKIGRIMIEAQQNAARVGNWPHYYHSYSLPYPYHVLVNAKGETPECMGLPVLPDLAGLPSNLYPNYRSMAAQYLYFYGIGHELIQEGDEPTVKEDKMTEAVQALRRYFYA
ncbi:hypothetical protein FRC12_004349 [Ceratobasidium sp. 428]|nr:hypothetical protein FRC12_004349 [Ceratobasidium sp. 428]